MASPGGELSYFTRHTAAVFEFARSLIAGPADDCGTGLPQEIEDRPGPVLVYRRAADMREPASAAAPGGARPVPVDQTGPAMNSENRRNRRQMCSEVVNISFADATGRRIADVGIIEDVNHNGLCLSLEVSLPVTTAVKISNEQVEADARVSHCTPQDYGYSVGLEFAEGSEWDPRQWQPKHLLEIPIDAE